MVSVFDGQLCRTWHYTSEEASIAPSSSGSETGTNETARRHVINLFHDTLTGVRSALVDYEEVPDSLGTSALLMGSEGHKITFSLKPFEEQGYILVKRSGWIGFEYKCFIGNTQLSEATETVAKGQEDQAYSVDIIEYMSTPDELSEQYIVWYVVNTIRLYDGVRTTVHRRFKDFAELNSSVKQNLKGHHLRSSIPLLPTKEFKLMTDHQDPEFISERLVQLNMYINELIRVPHVAEMTCTKSFLGIMDQVRELSFLFPSESLGMNFADSHRPNTPVVIGSLLSSREANFKELRVGDIISKINGSAVSGCTFEEVIKRLQTLPRPVVIHFAKVVHSKTGIDGSSHSLSDSCHSLPDSQGLVQPAPPTPPRASPIPSGRISSSKSLASSSS